MDTTVSCMEALVFMYDSLDYTNNQIETCEISGNVPGTLAGTFDECGGEQTVTWTFTDNCGRTINHVQTITIEPAPEADWVDPPADITLSCDEAQNFTVSDLSYTNGESETCEISGNVPGTLAGTFNECGGEQTVTWTFTDSCGRTIEHIQTIAIEPAPVADWVDPPEFTTISCDEVNNYVVEDLSFTNEMTGNCQISGSVIGELSGDFEECGDQLIVTWEYLDFCERVIEYSNTIDIVDTISPTIFCPEDLIISCLSELPDPDVISVDANDNCGIESIVHVIDESSSMDCIETIERIYMATDICDNITECTQMISIVDSIGPVFQDTPEDLILNCESLIPPMQALEWNDLCGNSGVEMGVETSDGESNPETITRTWVISEGCYNETIFIQTITVYNVEDTFLEVEIWSVPNP